MQEARAEEEVAATPSRGTSGMGVDVYRAWADVADWWPQSDDPAVTATPFQGRTWLAAWYATVGRQTGLEALLVVVRDRLTGQPIVLLPLVLSRQGKIPVITFADLGVTDYNAPVIFRVAIGSEALAPVALWRAVKAALPAAALVRLEKMPHEVAGVANPLAALPGAQPSTLIGNIVIISGTWEGYLKSLERMFRKELGRILRVFERHEGARFERVFDLQRAQHVLTGLERLQAERIAELGLPYTLDEAHNAALYRKLVADHLGDGQVMLTALTAGDEVVAGLLGIADGTRYAMVRLGTAGGEWRNCSPGRLVIERTMHALFADGRRSFDFTTGEYPYKRRLGATPVVLTEVTQALSWHGAPAVLQARAKGVLRQYPRLKALVRGGKQDRATEV